MFKNHFKKFADSFVFPFKIKPAEKSFNARCLAVFNGVCTFGNVGGSCVSSSVKNSVFLFGNDGFKEIKNVRLKTCAHHFNSHGVEFFYLERTVLKKMFTHHYFINRVTDERKGKPVKSVSADFLFGNFYQKNAAFQNI